MKTLGHNEGVRCNNFVINLVISSKRPRLIKFCSNKYTNVREVPTIPDQASKMKYKVPVSL